MIHCMSSENGMFITGVPENCEMRRSSPLDQFINLLGPGPRTISMNAHDFLTRLDQLTIWKNADKRAPNKPLMLLLALSQFQNFERERLLFEEVDPALRKLLEEFGPPVRTVKTTDPFWRLEKDHIWVTNAPESIRPPTGGGNINKSDLIKHHVSGGFSPEVIALLKKSPSLIDQSVQLILNKHFPATYHEEILETLGLGEIASRSNLTGKRKRDPAFREEVLTAYGYACAVCGLRVIMSGRPIALEAAHIRWHQAQGPDHVSNGLALCSLHHKLLDYGAFTVNNYGIIEVSDHANGNAGFESWLRKFHHEPIARPSRSVHEPKPEYFQWHRTQVFKGSPRD